MAASKNKPQFLPYGKIDDAQGILKWVLQSIICTQNVYFFSINFNPSTVSCVALVFSSLFFIRIVMPSIFSSCPSPFLKLCEARTHNAQFRRACFLFSNKNYYNILMAAAAVSYIFLVILGAAVVCRHQKYYHLQSQ